MSWVTVPEASCMLGKSTKTLYCKASRDRAHKEESRFKRVNGVILVNIEAFDGETCFRYDAVKQDTQLEFEELYFMLIDAIGKPLLCKELGLRLGKTHHAVDMYFRDVFLSGTETTKNKYVNAMQQIKQGL